MRDRIEKLLRSSPPLKPVQIAPAIGERLENVHRVLRGMVTSKRLIRTGNGFYSINRNPEPVKPEPNRIERLRGNPKKKTGPKPKRKPNVKQSTWPHTPKPLSVPAPKKQQKLYPYVTVKADDIDAAINAVFSPAIIARPDVVAANNNLNKFLRARLDNMTYKLFTKRQASTRLIDIITTNRLPEQNTMNHKEGSVERAKQKMMEEVDDLVRKVKMPEVRIPTLPNAQLKIDIATRLFNGLLEGEKAIEMSEYIAWTERVLEVLNSTDTND